MAIRWDDFVARLPEEHHEAIGKRTAELIAEEATPRRIREARARSQEEVAGQPPIEQAAVSELERRTDMYLSTRRNFIEAMGGQLEIIARCPDPAVRITPFEALDPESRPEG
jgi:hypothetical protein